MNTKIVAAMALVALAGAANAETVLVWGTGNDNVGGSTANIAAWLQASGRFTSVDATGSDYVDFNTLNSYDKVFYFSNTSGLQDPTAVGDVLADFADTGKRLVLGTFAWADQGANTLGGRIMSGAISPFTITGSSIYSNVTIGSTDGSLFWGGVSSINGFFHDNVGIAGGATLRGSWSDGSPLLATKGNVVAVNLFADDAFDLVSGDYRQLFTNALDEVPAPGTIGALSIFGLAALRRRR